MSRVTDFREVDLIVTDNIPLPREVAEYLRLYWPAPRIVIDGKTGSCFTIPQYMMDEWVQKYDMVLPAPRNDHD
jgi:hypothetical protein